MRETLLLIGLGLGLVAWLATLGGDHGRDSVS